MAQRMPYLKAALLAFLISFLPVVTPTIPVDWNKINSWFDHKVGNLESRKAFLLPELVAAETNREVITVRVDGSGQFKTITDAINSIPEGNKKRVVVSVGPGIYFEKVQINKSKPFITLYGSPINMPTLVYNDTAASANGTVYSGTLTVYADHFSAVNMIFKNSAPPPDGRPNAQAVAMRISGDYASFYNCKFYGFQDTLLDDRGKHLYKDCYIEGTVDFIFGQGRTLFLSTEVHIVGDGEAFVTAHSRKTADEPSGFVFVACRVTGAGKGRAYLGRPWFSYARVIFAYCVIGDVINPLGWYNDMPTMRITHAYFAERKNRGPGGFDLRKRAPVVVELPPSEVPVFVDLTYIEASKWLLGPTSVDLPMDFEFDDEDDDLLF